MENEANQMSLADGLKLASQHFEEGNYHQSEHIYSAILRVQPENLIANKRMAAINESFGRFDEALEFYKTALKTSPIHLEFLTGYIRILIKTGRIQEARAVLKQTKTMYEEAKAFDQINSLRKQLNPGKKLEFFYKYLESLGIFDFEAGQLMCSDSRTIPLLTNTFINWFETQHWKDNTLLELGSGSSTLFFAKYFKKVYSLETNQSWFSKLSEALPQNVEYKKVDRIIDSLNSADLNSYDAILLDCGENRANVAKILAERSYNGIIFFDNSEWYRKSIQILNSYGFFEIPFFGVKPVENWVSCTSVLAQESNLNEITNSNWEKLPELAGYRPSNAWDIADG